MSNRPEMNRNAIFMISSKDGSRSIIIRHRCMSCVREMAATNSPADEFAMWSDKAQSYVTLPKPEIAREFSLLGAPAILKRIDHDQ